MRVRGVLFADYVRIIRRALPTWRELIDPQDVALVSSRIDLEQWYPMDTFGRLGVVILEHIIGDEHDAVRLWGREQVATILQFFPELAVGNEPRDSVLRFQGYLSSLFDFPAVRVELLEDERAQLRVHYGLPPRPEEAATWQTLGFFEELLTASGAREVELSVPTRKWEGAFDTRAELRWICRARTPRPALERPRVLLVEDELLVARGLTRLLHKAMELVIAATPSEAIKLLEAREFDAVLCDFNLPERDGLSLCEEIRARWPRLKRVLHSGAMPPHAPEAKRNGVVHELLDKPAPRDVLIAALSIPA